MVPGEIAAFTPAMDNTAYSVIVFEHHNILCLIVALLAYVDHGYVWTYNQSVKSILGGSPKCLNVLYLITTVCSVTLTLLLLRWSSAWVNAQAVSVIANVHVE